MARVIVERPRRGSRHATTNDEKGWGRRNASKGHDEDKYEKLENLPQKESMTRRYGWNRKELNENLSPLRRFLMKSVNRPWDKVFSEICENINTNSTVQQHIRQHVFDTVENNTFIGKDGKVWYHVAYHRGTGDMSEPIADSYKDLYIHPENGLLLKNKNKKRNRYNYKKQRQEEIDQIRREGPDADHQLHNIDGIWYVIELKPLPEKLYEMKRTPDGALFKDPTSEAHQRDIMLHNALQHLSASEFERMYGRKVFGVSKKQANSKELKAAGGLVNNPLSRFDLKLTGNKYGHVDRNKFEKEVKALKITNYRLNLADYYLTSDLSMSMTPEDANIIKEAIEAKKCEIILQIRPARKGA